MRRSRKGRRSDRSERDYTLHKKMKSEKPVQKKKKLKSGGRNNLRREKQDPLVVSSLCPSKEGSKKEERLTRRSHARKTLWCGGVLASIVLTVLKWM